MEITKEFLLSEIQNLAKQRDHAHDVAVASQAAIDAYTALTHRLDTEDKTPTFADMGLPDPVPIAQ